MLVFAGDQGRLARGAAELTANLSSVSAHILRGYEWQPWSDVIADRGAEIGAAVLDFLDRHPLPTVRLSEPEGQVAGITYRIRGAGPPLFLMPLSLAPSQWDPLIATLSARYCTISLGGPLLGVVGILEERGLSNYLAMVKSLLDLVDIRPNEVVLEVGGGSGVVVREIARRTAGANRIINVDISPYLLREAEALARQAGLADRISFQEGNAEAIPLADDSVDVALSFTVMEEGDADRMLSELVRVTRPGGRIAAIVRSLDMPWWTNAALGPALRAKVDIPGRGDVASAGCADASLYQRFRRAGLVGLTCFSQLSSVDASHVSRIAVLKRMILAGLTGEESAEWESVVAEAEAARTFFIATPHHCAVGIKPPATG
jgi:SAM-dependent methyltransferase